MQQRSTEQRAAVELEDVINQSLNVSSLETVCLTTVKC